MVIYTCKAITLEENKKIKCTVNIATNQIQLIGKFANHAKGRVIKFDDFRLLSTIMGKEKLGLLKKDYIEIIYNGKSLRKLYFKNIDTAHGFENAIKDKQETIRKEDERKRLEEEQREKKRKNEIYNDACILMSKCTIESLNQAKAKFLSILYWKDSATKINICNNKIPELEKKQEEDRKNRIYDEAVFAMNRGNPASYKIALDKFKSILNWRDSKQLSSRCEEKIDEAYNAAMALMSTNTLQDFEIATKKFQEIIGWKDSRAKINVCKSKIDEIKLKEENERKQKSYDAAVTEAQKDTIVSYEKAIRVLTSISGWKDSSELIKKYNKRIEEIHIQEENDRKEKTYLDALKFASGKTVKDQENAIKLFTEVIEWKDANDQIEKCKRTIKQIEEAEFYKKIDEVISKAKQEEDKPQKYSFELKTAAKAARDLIVRNPYFILGISCTSEQSKMLDVRDKIEKFARLKLAGGYKSAFDLKNIEKPSRDLSSVQTAIVSAKDIAAKWLWFETDKYCSWWDKDEIFYLCEKEIECLEYDLILACLFNVIICNPYFTNSHKWNTVLASIDKFLAQPNRKLLKSLKKHIGNTSLTDEEIISSFKASIIKPITLLIEGVPKEQISNFLELKVPNVMYEEISSSIVSNVTNICYPLNIYVKEIENDKVKTNITKLLWLINDVESNVYKKMEAYISVVGENSTYAKRIKKKYKDAIWNATTILDNNNMKNKSLPYIIEIYMYCDDGDKRRLRNTYGYEELGLAEDALTPGEMNDVAIECINNGSKTKGLRLLRKAADGGDANAQSNLAFRYYNGSDGVIKDIDTAICWWKRSGNKGNPTAQHALFSLYMEQGYRQNISEAMRWLRKACDQNFKPSMEVFDKIVNMAKSYDYQERNAGLDLLRKMGLDV